MKRNIPALVLALALALSLAACGSKAESPADSSADQNTAAPTETDAKTYKVAVIKQLDHASLDEIANAVTAELDQISADKNVKIEYEVTSGQGDQTILKQLCDQAIADKVDVIVPIATTAAQVATLSAEGTGVKVVYAAISDPAAANLTGIDYVTGTSDALNTSFILDMMFAQNPDIKKVGLLYCSAEANSQYQVDEVQKYLEAKGVTATQYAFSDSNDLASVCQKAADENDAVYVPTDNTCAANTGIIDGICRPAKKPVFAGEEGICAGCGVATLSISYYDLGYTTGEMAVKILNGESDISTMPIEYTDVTKKYNKAVCDDLGLTVPEGYVEIEA